MDLEDVLRVLLGWVGQGVEVNIGALDGPLLAASMRGTLKAGTDIAVEDPWPRVKQGEALYFCFAEDTGSGFFLHADEFRQAEWTGPEGDLLVVVTGGLVFRFGVGD